MQAAPSMPAVQNRVVRYPETRRATFRNSSRLFYSTISPVFINHKIYLHNISIQGVFLFMKKICKHRFRALVVHLATLTFAGSASVNVLKGFRDGFRVRVFLLFLNCCRQYRNKRFVIKEGVKVIRKFFLKHNKSFRWHLGDYEKHNFFGHTRHP